MTRQAEAAARQIATAHAAAEQASAWPELVPFDTEDARDVPDFPLGALPNVLARYAESIAGNLLCPVDLPAVAIVGTVSASIAGRVRVEAGPDWIEPANLYLLSVLPPSMHKSPVLKLATKPVEQEEEDLRSRWRTDETERRGRRESIAHRIATVKKSPSSADTEAELTKAIAEQAKFEAKPCPQLLSDDATSEALSRKLANGPLFVASAEGRPFELMSGLYRKAGEDGADVYLKAWSGDPLRVSRVSAGDLHVPHPCLSLFLAVQPAVVAKLGAREDFRGRGLIARFLASYPRTRVGKRDWRSAEPIDQAMAFQYGHRVRALLGLDLPAAGSTAPVVTFSAEAASAFMGYRCETEVAMGRDGRLAESSELGGKLAGHAARIALALHMAEHGASGVAVPLSGETMARALDLARYFEAHTMATWDGCAADSIGARVVRWFAKKGPTVSTRDVHRAFGRKLVSAEAARRVCAELAERGYLRSGGEADVWEVRPDIRALVEAPPTVPTGASGKAKRLTIKSASAVGATKPTPTDTVDRSKARKPKADGVGVVGGCQLPPADPRQCDLFEDSSGVGSVGTISGGE